MIRTILVGLYALAALLLAVLPTAAQSPTGQWAGTVFEKDIGSYTVVVQIDQNRKTGAVHFLYYPCGGSLNLVGSRGSVFLFQEKLTYGTKKCLNNLQTRFTLQSANTALFEELIRGVASAKGTLKRVRQVSRN